MNKIEHKSIDVETSNMEVDKDTRIIQGYFSIFDTVDQGRDIVRKGSFTKTISERGPRETPKGPRSKIKMAYNHGKVIGIPIRLYEDSKGGFFEGRVSETPFGDDILTMVKDGTIDGASFEYMVMKASYPTKDKSVDREITEVKLYETGPVDNGMHEDASVDKKSLRKSIGEMCDELLYLICKKNTDITDVKQLKALYDELTERLRVAEPESLPEIKSQPNGDLVLEKLQSFQLKMEKL